MEENKNKQLNGNDSGIDVEKLRRKIRKSEFSVKSYQYFILRALLVIGLVWILFFKIVGLTTAPGDDMAPSVKHGDLMLFYRLDKTYRYRDVIVYESDPDESGEKDVYVGRIIAAPGDTLDISENGAVIVNGNTLVEQDIRTATPVYGEFVEYPVRLGENEFFVLADDRLNGMDSRYIGAVEKKDVIGSVITIVRRHDL